MNFLIYRKCFPFYKSYTMRIEISWVSIQTLNLDVKPKREKSITWYCIHYHGLLESSDAKMLENSWP